MIRGYFRGADFRWLMSKMKSLQHLTFEPDRLFSKVGFEDFPPTLETLIIRDTADILWMEHSRSVKWTLPSALMFLHLKVNTNGTHICPSLKHIEIQVISVACCCLYDPVVDGYDEYGPKYDYREDYLETKTLLDYVPYSTFYEEEGPYEIDESRFPALERFIVPEIKEEKPLDIKLVESLPWSHYTEE